MIVSEGNDCYPSVRIEVCGTDNNQGKHQKYGV